MHNKLQYGTKLWLFFGLALLLVALSMYFAPILASIPIIFGVYIFYSILKHYEK